MNPTQELGSVIDTAVADVGEHVVLQAVLVTEIGVHRQPLEHIVGDVQGAGEILLAAFLDDTLFIAVGDGGVELLLALESVHGQGVVLVGRDAGNVLDPVRALSHGERLRYGQCNLPCGLTFVRGYWLPSS